MNLINRIGASLLDGQHGHPTGIIGRMLGERMVHQHMPETTWTISLLHLKPEDQILEIFRVLKSGAILVVTLSTGKIDPTEATGLERYQLMLEEQIIPTMKQPGFTQANIMQGPASRQFKTTAVIGVK